MLALLVLGLSLLGSSTTAMEEAHFLVEMDRFQEQGMAQEHAISRGGWVLGANLYSDLESDGTTQGGSFLSVRGPFPTREEAERLASELRRLAVAPNATVRALGEPSQALAELAGDLPPPVFAAVLGQMRIDLSPSGGGNHPCEPQESNQAIGVSFVSGERAWGGEDGTEITIRSVKSQVELGGLWYLPGTDSIVRMAVCSE